MSPAALAPLLGLWIKELFQVMLFGGGKRLTNGVVQRSPRKRQRSQLIVATPEERRNHHYQEVSIRMHLTLFASRRLAACVPSVTVLMK
jgi:hypothetical protein